MKQITWRNRSYEPGSRAQSRRISIIEGASARTIFNLTSGAFLVGLLKYMGMDDSLCGKIAAIPVLTAMVQFVSPIFMENLPWKKKIVTIGCFLHRFLLCLLFLIPALPIAFQAKTVLTIIVYFISYLMMNFIVPAVQAMMVAFTKPASRGRYFGIRESYVLFVSALISLLLGKLLDDFSAAGQEYIGYLIIMGVCVIGLVVNTTSFIYMNEVRIKPSNEKIALKTAMTVPIKNKRFRKIIVLFFLWNISLQIGAAFFGVYMVSSLELSYTFITINSVLFSLTYIVSARYWGRVADQTSWARVTMLTMGILGLTHFMWLFVYHGNPIMSLLIILLHMSAGTGWGGINIALFNIPFDYIQDKRRMLYIGFNAALSGFVGYLSAYFGAEMVKRFEALHLELAGVPVGILQIVLALSGVLIALTALYIRVVLLKEVPQAVS